MWPRLRTTSDLHLGLPVGTDGVIFSSPLPLGRVQTQSLVAFLRALPIVPMSVPDRHLEHACFSIHLEKGISSSHFFIVRVVAYSQMCLIHMITYLSSCQRGVVDVYRLSLTSQPTSALLQLSTQFYILKTNQHKENGHKYLTLPFTHKTINMLCCSYPCRSNPSRPHYTPLFATENLTSSPTHHAFPPNPRSPYRSTSFRCKLPISRVVNGDGCKSLYMWKVMKPNRPQRYRHWMGTLMIWGHWLFDDVTS